MIYLHLLAQKGIGANLLRVGIKRRRTKTQIEEEKQEAELRERAVNESLVENEQLKSQLTQMQNQGQNNQKAADILSELLSKGLITQDDSGNIDVPSASKKRPNAS